MALSPSSSSDQPTGLVNIASLLQTLAPIFLGGGPQTSTTSGGTTTTKATSSVGNAPDILSAILGSVNTAASNAQDTTKTDALVANIMTESARAFTPTIAAQNSAGLYNSSTLSLLSGDARARATAASSKAVLDYQTGQQQIAQQGLSTVAANNKSTTTEQATATPTSSTIKLQAPAINPITSLLTLGGGVLANKLLGSKTVEGASSSFLDFLGLGGNSATGLPGGGTPFLGGGEAGITIGESGAVADAASTLSPTASATSNLSISSAPGATFTDIPGSFTAGAAGGLGEAGLGELLSSFGAETGVAAGVGGDVALGAAGGIAPEAAGGAVFGDIAGGAGAAGALGGEATLAGIGSLGGLELGGAGALAAGFASDAAIAGGAGAAAGAGGIAGIGEIASTILEVLGAVVGWVVCTELATQGKIDKKIYKYGMLHFSKYSKRSREAYWLWGSPLSSYIHRKPSSSITKVAAWVMKKRMEHIASLYEKGKYRKTISNSLCFYGVGYSTFLIQIILFILGKRIELPLALEVRTRRNATSLLLSTKGV